jgi:hypothetical protein
VAIVIAVLCVGGFVFAPKGDNQTYPNVQVFELILQSLAVLNYPSNRILLSSVDLPQEKTDNRWAITYLAQLHPLIEPRASKLRPDIIHGDSL